MAKGKPTRAFLEALQQEKKRRGEEKPGGGFQTPEWFFNNPQNTAAAPANPPLKPATSGQKGYQFVWWHGAIAAAAILLIVVMAYTMGRGQKPPQNSPAVDEIKASPVQGSVVDVPANPPSIPPTNPPTYLPVAPPPNTVDAADVGRPAVASDGRIVGMNYVIMQGFENDATANVAANALRKAGIGCTVERIDHVSKLILVVGTQGFAKSNSAECQAYMKKAMQVSDQYSGSSKWKKFQLLPYKWR